MMIEDDALREVRAAREEYSRQFGYDVGAIVRNLREKDRAEGWRVVRLPPRRPAPMNRDTAGAPDQNLGKG